MESARNTQQAEVMLPEDYPHELARRLIQENLEIFKQRSRDERIYKSPMFGSSVPLCKVTSSLVAPGKLPRASDQREMTILQSTPLLQKVVRTVCRWVFIVVYGNCILKESVLLFCSAFLSAMPVAICVPDIRVLKKDSAIRRCKSCIYM